MYVYLLNNSWKLYSFNIPYRLFFSIPTDAFNFSDFGDILMFNM